MAEYDEALKDKLDNSAADFSETLRELAAMYDNKFEKVVRKTVFDLFGNIVRRSPVDTGTYRASHGIANHDPSEGEAVVLLKGKDASPSDATSMAMSKANGWTWHLGQGDIFLFNNLPYAEPLENGHSGQAPEGIYYQALTEVNSIMQRSIVALRVGDWMR